MIAQYVGAYQRHLMEHSSMSQKVEGLLHEYMCLEIQKGGWNIIDKKWSSVTGWSSELNTQLEETWEELGDNMRAHLSE